MVHVGTGAVYGELGIVADNQLDEVRDPVRPAGMYAITKCGAERACLRLGALWGMDVVVGRPAMVFGPVGVRSGVRADGAAVADPPPRNARRGGADPPTSRNSGTGSTHRTSRRAGRAPRRVQALEPGVQRRHRHALQDIHDWCERLVAAYPGFRYRFVTDPAAANVLPLAAVGRSPFRVRRIRALEARFTPRYPLEQAFDDYTAWLRSRAAFG